MGDDAEDEHGHSRGELRAPIPVAGECGDDRRPDRPVTAAGPVAVRATASWPTSWPRRTTTTTSRANGPRGTPRAGAIARSRPGPSRWHTEAPGGRPRPRGEPGGPERRSFTLSRSGSVRTMRVTALPKERPQVDVPRTARDRRPGREVASGTRWYSATGRRLLDLIPASIMGGRPVSRAVSSRWQVPRHLEQSAMTV